MCEGLERERGENRVFHVEECIYNLKILLNELVLLIKIQLLALSMTFSIERIVCSVWNCTYHADLGEQIISCVELCLPRLSY